MSYRDPQQHIDTQTGQHFRNLQQDITNTVTKIAGAYDAEQAKKKLKMEADAKENARLYKVNTDTAIDLDSKLQVASKNNNMFNPENNRALSDVANTYADLNQLPKLTGEQKIWQTNVKTLPETIQKDLAFIGSYIIDVKAKSANAGEMNGFVTNQDPDGLTFTMGMANTLPGKRWFTIDNSKAGGSQITWHFKKDGGDGRVVSYTTDQLRQMQNTPGAEMIRTIPNESEDLQTMVGQGGFFKVVDGKVTKDLKDVYYENSKLETRSTTKNGVTTTETYKLADTPIMSKGLLTIAGSNIAGMTSTQQADFNNLLNKKIKLSDSGKAEGKTNKIYEEDLIPGSPLTEAQIDRLTQKYADYGLSLYVGYSEKIISKTETKIKDTKESTDTRFIDNLSIPLIKRKDGPSSEFSQPEAVDLDKLGFVIAKKGFRINASQKDTDGRNFKTITKGGKKSVDVYEGMTKQEVKDLLKQLETGENSPPDTREW